MVKTTVYLTQALKRGLTELAGRKKVSEAELIRAGIEQLLMKEAARRPTLPLFHGSDPHLAERVDEALRGFGS